VLGDRLDSLCYLSAGTDSGGFQFSLFKASLFY
jgi:hypothetical protein